MTNIGEYAFKECSALISVTVPNSVTNIGGEAFKGCSGLISVTLGNGVRTISDLAFANCPELADVYCHAKNAPNTYNDAFKDSYVEYATLHVPSASISSYKAKEPWKNFKSIVALTDSDPKPTGIENVRSQMSDVKGAFFDLNGRRMNGEPTQKGVYIQNGKKIIVK